MEGGKRRNERGESKWGESRQNEHPPSISLAVSYNPPHPANYFVSNMAK
jgi:hypothetical protein